MMIKIVAVAALFLMVFLATPVKAELRCWWDGFGMRCAPGWTWQERREWREHEWRERQRDHEREHEWDRRHEWYR